MISEDKDTHLYCRLLPKDLEEFKNKFTAIVGGYYATKKGYIMVDLVDLDKIDSTALGAMLTASRTAESAGSKLVLLRPCDAVVRILEITRTLGKFPIFPSEFKALQELSKA
jgi:anti-anti-sigma factor